MSTCTMKSIEQATRRKIDALFDQIGSEINVKFEVILHLVVILSIVECLATVEQNLDRKLNGLWNFFH